jgi:hypothetical protein
MIKYKILNTEVLERANMSSMHATLRWLGHVKRMEAGRIPKDLLHGELATGVRTAGHPKLRFKDVCKADMKQCNIVHSTWESLADDRSTWRQAVQQGTKCAEAARDEASITKRTRWKQR